MSLITKVNTGYTQARANNAKMGAYYTDIEHCKRIGKLIDFPKEDYCAIDPSIGDGSAVIAVTAKNEPNDNVHIYGVELNKQTCVKCLQNNDFIESYLNADYIRGTKISRKKFSFCFANPPYGDAGDGKRLETLFVERIYQQMKRDGLLALVIPSFLLGYEEFNNTLISKFTVLSAFRFDDKEYKKYKQIVIFAYAKAFVGIKPVDRENYSEIVNLNNMEYLPELGECKPLFKVQSSHPEDIVYFTTSVFDADQHKAALRYGSFSRLFKGVSVPKYTSINVGQPPMPLKKDLLYLVSISGGGEGLVGNEKDGDVHLQRGIVEKQDNSIVQRNKDGDAISLKVTTAAAISLNIIDNDFNFIKLEGESSVVEEDETDEDD